MILRHNAWLRCRVQPQLVLQVHPQSSLAVQPGAAGGNVLYFMNTPSSGAGASPGISQLSVSTTPVATPLKPDNEPTTPVTTATDANKTAAGDGKIYSNSTRWSDPETRILLEIWRLNYFKLRGKFRNYQEWEEIANEFNRRCVASNCGTLGPRSGPQCKIRIKNLTSEYKRLKAQNSKSVNKAFHHYYDFLDDVFTRSFIANAEPFTVVSPDASHSHSPQSVFTAVTPEIPAQDTASNSAVFLQDQIKQEPGIPAAPEINSVSSAPLTASDTTVSTPLGISTTQELAQASVTGFKTRPILPKPPSGTSDADTRSLGYVIRHEPPVVLTDHPETPEMNISVDEPTSASAPSTSSTTVATAQDTKSTKRPLETVPEASHKKKLRKNFRNAKKANDDEDKLVNVLREFMDESQKRDKELFTKMMEMQVQAERRNQEFILKVVKEIGNIFKANN